jgi:hypothetical protein
MPCRICQYNQVSAIDRALLAGVSPTSLHQRHQSFSIPELQRHQEHLQQKMALAGQRFHDGLRQGLYCKLYIVMEMVLGVVRAARGRDDFKLFLQASREFSRIVSLMDKMAVHLEPEMIYCLMASPQWDLQEDNLLPSSFQALSKTRQSLKVNLFAPCPEPEPEPDPGTALSSTREIHLAERKTPAATPNPEPLPEVSAILARDQSNTQEIGNRQPAEKQARN